jgi:hypothetical protein
MVRAMIRIILIMMMALASAVTVAAAPAAPISAKQRIEREFRLLETALARCIYEDVISSPDIELMNRALYDFMRDNPGVTRILRVNAGGFTVNDVSAESPRSAPPRSVSGQRWFQHISQGKAPYYSMEAAPDGQITLFYAWPMTASSGLETTVTGGFAAYIDLISQVALIDDAPPFRILYAGKTIFEHDWDGLEYDEEPLPIRGVRDVTINTLKPMSTRLDQRTAPQASKAKSGVAQSTSKRLSDTDGADDDEDAAAPPEKQKKEKSGGGYMTKILIALLLLIVIMLCYSMYGEKIARSVRAWNDTKSMKAQRDTASSMPVVQDAQSIPQQIYQAPQPQIPLSPSTQPPPQPMLPPQPIVTKIVSERSEKAEKLYKEQQKTIAKMAGLIRKRIDVMENRIETLTKKLEEMEKELKSKNKDQNL